jgi:hypothetical protein
MSFIQKAMIASFVRKMVAVSVILMLSGGARAAVYYSKPSADSNFSSLSSWTVDTLLNPDIPSLGTNNTFVIRNGHQIVLNANRTVGQVIIRSGGTMSLRGNYSLTTASAFTIDAGGVLTLVERRITVNGNWINNGLIEMTIGYFTCNTGAGINNGTISITDAGRLVRTTGSFVNAGTVELATGGRFTATTGPFTNTVTGTLSLTGAGTVTLGTGDFVNDNTSESVNFGTAAIAITGTVKQGIDGFITGGRITCSKTADTASFTGNITSNGITINGLGGTLDLGTGLTHTSLGTVTMTTGTMYGNASTLYVNVVSTSAWGGVNAPGFVAGTSTVILNAAGNQRISATNGDNLFYNLTFANSGQKTKTGTVSAIVSNILSIEENATTGGATAIPALDVNATLRYNTPNPRNAGLEWVTPFTAAGGVIIDNTGTITANGDKEFGTNVPLTISSGATLATGPRHFSFSGDLINNGTWESSTGDITITGTVNQDIGAFSTTGTVMMTKTDGVAILQGDMHTGNLIMDGVGGTLRLGTGNTHTVAGTWTNTNGILRCNTSTLNIDGAVSGDAIAFNPNNGLVHFRGMSAQSIPGFTYNDLRFSGTGVKTMSGNTTVTDVMIINAAAECNLGAFTLELTGNGVPLVNNGSLIPASSTVLYSGTGSVEIAAVGYHNLDASGGDRILSSADTIGIAGVFIPGTGVYAVDDSIVDFNGSGDQDIPAFEFHDLIISNAGIKKILASITVICQTINIEDDASVEINADGGGKLNVVQ